MAITRELPEEILADILRRLPPRGLARSRCVCQAWCNAVDEHRLLRADLLPRAVRGIFMNYCALYNPEFFSRPPTGPPIWGDLEFIRGSERSRTTATASCSAKPQAGTSTSPTPRRGGGRGCLATRHLRAWCMTQSLIVSSDSSLVLIECSVLKSQFTAHNFNHSIRDFLNYFCHFVADVVADSGDSGSGRDDAESAGGGRDDAESPGGGRDDAESPGGGRDNAESPGGGRDDPESTDGGRDGAESAGGGSDGAESAGGGRDGAETHGRADGRRQRDDDDGRATVRLTRPSAATDAAQLYHNSNYDEEHHEPARDSGAEPLDFGARHVLPVSSWILPAPSGGCCRSRTAWRTRGRAVGTSLLQGSALSECCCISH
ncbi:hypothetical protein EJB05_06501, partial [Eragrostis curvula]